nr:hypothetical protein [Candidatus Delongbacteria bacterium]
MNRLFKVLYPLLFSVMMIYGQSSINVESGSMITIGADSDISAGSRSGCFSGEGTFNGQPLIGIPAVTPMTNLEQTSFSANWTAVSGAAGYLLDVATDSNFGAGTMMTGYDSLDVGNVTSYSVTGLTAGVTYYYRIRAYELCAVSRFSDTLSLLMIPADPVAAAATLISDTGMTANWNAVIGVTHYYLDIATDAAFSPGSFVSAYNNLNVGNVTTRSVTGLSPATRYYYRVRSVNASGTSGHSNTIDTLTLTAAPLAQPATALRTDSITANWAGVTGADTYYLDVSTDAAFGPGNFVSGYSNLNTGNVISRIVTGLSPNLRYYYRIRAHNASGISANSNVIDTLTLPANPDALPATEIDTTAFTANWTLPSDAAGYYLDIAVDSEFTHYITDYQNRDVGHVTNRRVDSGILAGTTYYYRVRSVNASGTSGHSDTVKVTTLTVAPLALAASSVLSTSFTANWAGVTGADAYYLDVSTDAAFGPGNFVPGFNNRNNNLDTTCQITGLTVAIRYYYRVRAHNSTGLSGNSNVIDQMTIPDPPIADTVQNIQTSGFTLIWNPSPGAGGYQLDIATDSLFAHYVPGYQNQDVGNTTQYTTGTQLQSGTSYFSRIRAYNDGGASGYSAILHAITLPDPPVAKAAREIWSTDFIAVWEPSTGADNYQIEVAADINFTQRLTDYMSLDVGNVNQFKIDKGIE